jgi:hypothetical protein
LYVFLLFRHPITIELLLWTLSALFGLAFSAIQVRNALSDLRVVKQWGFNGTRLVISRGLLRRELNRAIEQLLFLFIAFEATFLFPPLPKGVSLKQLPGPTVRGELFAYALIGAASLVTANTFFDRRDRIKANREIEKRG